MYCGFLLRSSSLSPDSCTTTRHSFLVLRFFLQISLSGQSDGILADVFPEARMCQAERECSWGASIECGFAQSQRSERNTFHQAYGRCRSCHTHDQIEQHHHAPPIHPTHRSSLSPPPFTSSPTSSPALLPSLLACFFASVLDFCVGASGKFIGQRPPVAGRHGTSTGDEPGQREKPEVCVGLFGADSAVAAAVGRGRDLRHG